MIQKNMKNKLLMKIVDYKIKKKKVNVRNIFLTILSILILNFD